MIQDFLATMGILLGVRTATLLLLLVVACGAPAQPAPALQAYLGVPRYDRPRWDPEGRRLVFVSQQLLYLRDRGGNIRSLSRSLSPVTAFFWTSDGRALIAEVGRESSTRIYRVRVEDGRAEPLTPADQSCRHPVLQAGWLAYSRDDSAIYLRQLESGQTRKLYQGSTGRLWPVRFSPDGQSLLALNERSSLETDLLIVDVASGKARVLSTGFRIAEPRWRGNGKVTALTDKGRDFLALSELDLETGQWSVLASAPGELESYAWDRQQNLAYVVNEGTGSRLYLLPPHSRARAIDTPQGVIRHLAFRPDGQLAFWLSGPRQPGSAWLLDLQTGAPRRILSPATDHLTLATPRRVVIAGAEGLSIQALLYPGRPGSPAVLLLHGGPANQSRPEFSPLLQFLAARGYTLLLPDYRGSLGYGRGFLAADDGPRRTLAVDDVVAAGRWLAREGHPRVALAGYSYGGFLALAALAREPEFFRGAVSLSGISDLSLFVQSIPGRRQTRTEEFGLDENVLAELSPLHQVPRLRRPVLVLHGDSDYRVPVEDALRYVAALKKAGAPVEFCRLEGEGHGLTRPATRQAGYEAMLAFLDRITAP